MSDLTQLRDEDLRTALFDALVDRFDAEVLEDRSITVVNRMPTVFAISRRSNLLTLSQGIGMTLLRGDLKWKDRLEKPRWFTVSRSTIHSRLAIVPDRVEGTPEEILDHIVVMFLDWTATEEDTEERRQTTSESDVEVSTPASPGAAREPRVASSRSAGKPTLGSRTVAPRARPEGPPTSGGSRQDPMPETPQHLHASRREPVEDTRPSAEGASAGHPVPHMAGKQKRTDAVPPRLSSIQEPTGPTLRTYELLLETAQRECDQAKGLPVSSRYCLISAGVFVALTAEAFFNDLGSRVIPSWSMLQRLDPREKAEVLSIELFNAKVDWSTRPFQSVTEALGFRRALAHAHSETLPFDRSRSAGGPESEVSRTRQTAWLGFCNVATIQQWIADVHLVIARFSKAHDFI